MVSIVTAVGGVALLYAVLLFMQPEIVEPDDDLKSKIGHNVQVTGLVTSQRETKGNIFLVLENKTDLVMFSTEAERNPKVYEIKEGDNVTVIGKVQYYKSRLEIIVKDIK
jgi:aspartyl/asparaginyl-tRNA synthetase